MAKKERLIKLELKAAWIGSEEQIEKAELEIESFCEYFERLGIPIATAITRTAL